MQFMTEHPDYRTYHQHTRVPEELFFHSILAGTDFAYEVVNDCLRFNAWDGMRARVLTTDDLPAMLESNKLFARKFDGDVDATVLDRLEELVLPDQHVQAA